MLCLYSTIVLQRKYISLLNWTVHHFPLCYHGISCVINLFYQTRLIIESAYLLRIYIGRRSCVVEVNQNIGHLFVGP